MDISMNAIQILKYNNQSIRQTVSEDGEILFCARDIAQALEYKDARDVVRVLDDEDEPHLLRCTDSSGRDQEMIFVDEHQLYAILLALKTERTKPFRRWVTHEVLPSIRKTGSYSMNGSLNLLGNLPESIKAICQDFEELRSKIAELEPLARERRKTLVQRKRYNSSPKRKNDVHVKYSDGRHSWIRNLPDDVSEFLNSLHSPTEAGRIIEEADRVKYIRAVVIPRCRKYRG